ncbi:MAG: hypothetical protein VKJ86_11150 [Synechococcus sp.]|nr:hypothetical protein [Synechococcus sp.]
MAKNHQRIRQAAQLNHQGFSFAAIGEKLGVGSSTVFRWSKSSEIWQEEVNALRQIDAVEFAREYRQGLESHRDRLKKAGITSMGLGIQVLVKMKALLDHLDVEAIEPDRRVQALEYLGKTYDRLMDGGKTLFTEMTGVEQVIEELEMMKPMPKQ